MTDPLTEQAPTEPAFLAEIRASYDTVAEPYAELVVPAFGRDVIGRSMMGAFAELVREAGGGPVVDFGCGPGHVTNHLAGLGLDVSGVDLSPGMVAAARRGYPASRFTVGTMTAPDVPDATLAGIVAWYSLIHLPPSELPSVFGHFARILRPGAHVLLGFHIGDGHRRKTKGYGDHPMSLDVHRLRPARLTELAAAAGLSTFTTVVSDDEAHPVPQGAMLLRRPPEQR